MTDPHEVVVDVIAVGEEPDEWQMVLVEAGPWEGETITHLKRIQARMYGCVDAALDGQLSAKFPDAIGKWVLIVLDCYGGPQNEIQRFFDRFSDGVFSIDDYRKSLQEQAFVQGIRFQLNLGSLPS
ncbi:hypothetical protein [Dyella amyloliquefaciens]|uniref:hypothetical protein n=1 Tax=Dyella amyloliquefaciens TaxID=1770545 RepID=UPI00102E7635|nr:hypothetical protein [Dyella amyloliquefaciens]